MSQWSLPVLLEQFHLDVQNRLETVRRSFAHPGTMGDASEEVWLEMLKTYLPRRYEAEKAFVVDSLGVFSHQIDVVIFDRQYSPFIFNFQGQKIIPAESVYAVFEAKQTINAGLVEYAQSKIASVRNLHRTSLPIPYAGGTYPPKMPGPILGGILTFDSDWTPPLGEPLSNALGRNLQDGRLDLGCVAAHGTFMRDASGTYTRVPRGKPATAFLFELIARLQELATVPMIDVRSYAKWLADDDLPAAGQGG